MSDRRDIMDRIHEIVLDWPTGRPKVKLPDTSRVYFVDPASEARARQAGHTFWLPVERAYAIFVCAYAALFAIPVLVEEALARQPDRFSPKRLPLTIRSTSSFILDAFGYDRRTDRDRSVLYSPGPVISSNHAETGAKARISDPAMAYFGLHLIREAEARAEAASADINWHFDYVADFFRTGGYRFPDRAQADRFIQVVDDGLSSNKHSDLWLNAVCAARELETRQKPVDIAASLPVKSRALFLDAITHAQQGGQQ